MITKDYYKILEIAPTATPQAIKQAYRRLALKYHPDRSFGDPQAEHRFKEIVEAYETLSDKHKKINYDYDYQKQKAAAASPGTPPPFAQAPPRTESALPTAQSLLKTFTEVRRSVESIDNRGKKIKQQALYNRLYELLSKNNIDLLQAAGHAKANRQIIDNVLRCCQFLAYPYVEDLSVRLARLAGTDNSAIEQIYQFTRQKKRWSFWERHKVSLAIAGVLIIFISVLLLIVSLTY